MVQATYIPDDEATVATLLRRAQWYRDYAERNPVVWDDRLRAADYLEAEAVRRTNPSFYREVKAA